ncbi:hypothetical protein GCM10009118_24020 [Wandonia haliotis]|uniref:RHS repeat-associated core domain-containing protein n=2 Tax=Wandonia haliotis TaxID=574963 RepID=A0ABN1MRW6_9FLAO
MWNATDGNYDPVILSWSDYYAFGMTMPGRNGNTGEYRYGYQGSEMDNEVKGNGNSYTTEFRQYDPRLGRWLSIDPKASKYPYESPYVAFHNNPIFYTDTRGDDPPEKLASAFAEAFKKAWSDSFRENGKRAVSGETGGVLIKVTTSTEVNGETIQNVNYEVHKYQVTQQGYVRLNYSGVPDNAEIVGDFHTHPYDEKETKQIRKWAPDFEPSAVPFSSSDLKDMSIQIAKGNITEGDVSFVVTEKVLYGIVVEDEKLAKSFLSNVESELNDLEIDIMNGTVKPKEGQSFNELQWQTILDVQKDYEAETGESSGVSFVKIDHNTDTKD